ncbi:MAG TPA: TraR/DksA C4-type zinc finger protein [Candidatus Paceibacterota bacterium]|nr:TraR/DksA C4-type zinc finger protein [Candidatus Paceibacterota bacterium]
MNTDFSEQKKSLEAELESLTKELKSVGRVNPDNPLDWEAVPEAIDTDSADSNNTSDKIDQYEENTAILKQLEARYNSVKDALARIDAGTYGTCKVCGKDIESERLAANPSATTCEEHMNS